MFTDELYYKLAFDVSDEQDLFLQQAILKYYLPDDSRLWIGKMFYNSLREDWPDPTQTASMDNSAMDYAFGLGTSLGLMWQSKTTDKTRWWVTLNNSNVGSRSPNAEAGKTDITLYGRFDYQVAGTRWSVWDDLIGRRRLPFGVLLGLTAGHMRNGNRDSGFDEDTTQLGMDLSINGDGYQVVLAGTWNEVSATDIVDYYNYGFYFQAGYFLSERWQAYIRYDYVSQGDQTGDLESYRAPGIGVNFFPRVNIRWRVTAEINYLFSALNKTIVEPLPELGWIATDESGQASFRIQLQLGF